MTPEEAYKMYCSFLVDKDDFIQECWLAILENPNEKPEVLFKDVGNKMRKQANKDVTIKAPHIYNEDGECVDDNVYFVDQSTVKQYGSGRRVDENLIEQGKKLSKTFNTLMRLMGMCYKRRTIHTSDIAQFNYLMYQLNNAKRDTKHNPHRTVYNWRRRFLND